MCCIHNAGETCEGKVALLVSLGHQFNEQCHKELSCVVPFCFEIVPVENARGDCYKMLALVRTFLNHEIVVAYIAINCDGSIFWDWTKNLYKHEYQKLVASVVSSELDIRYTPL